MTKTKPVCPSARLIMKTKPMRKTKLMMKTKDNDEDEAYISVLAQ